MSKVKQYYTDLTEKNVDEVLFTEKEDYWKKANKEGRSQ